MPTPELIRAFLSQATSSGSRSTALQPLAWLTCILTSGLVLVAPRAIPQWVLVSFVVLLILCVCIFLMSYLYFAFRNPDALRSEKFSLSKMAIEKNLIGDDKSGLLEIDELGRVSTLTAPPTTQRELK